MIKMIKVKIFNMLKCIKLKKECKGLSNSKTLCYFPVSSIQNIQFKIIITCLVTQLNKLISKNNKPIKMKFKNKIQKKQKNHKPQFKKANKKGELF